MAYSREMTISKNNEITPKTYTSEDKRANESPCWTIYRPDVVMTHITWTDAVDHLLFVVTDAVPCRSHQPRFQVGYHLNIAGGPELSGFPNRPYALYSPYTDCPGILRIKIDRSHSERFRHYAVGIISKLGDVM